MEPELKKHPTGFEVVRSVYCLAEDKKSDLLVIKGNEWREDGTVVPALRFIENYKRPFYVTKQGLRTHNDKREWEEKKNLVRYTCTQHELQFRVARALGKPTHTPYALLADSPYLYHADISPNVLVKYQALTKYPECISPRRTFATLDIEASPDKEKKVIIVTVFHNDISYLWVSEDWIGASNVMFIERVREEWVKRVEPMCTRPTELRIQIVPNAAQCIIHAINKLHELKPDFVSIWNMNYDVPTMVNELERSGYNVADIMSDPKVPPKYRFYKYIEGKSNKVKAGKEQSIHPADQWHKPIHPAGWFFVDSMGVYRTIRLAKGMEPDYTLDGTLYRNLKIRKLEMEGVDKIGGAWHEHMQKYEKIVYCAYASWDGISLAYLEEKTKDLAVTFPILCDNSEFENFKSNPTKIVDDMHLYCDERGYVMGTKPRQVQDALDKYVVTLDGWILALPAQQVSYTGYKCVAEDPKWNTRVFIQCGDADVTTTYPKIEETMNMSKGTTYSELSSINGFDHEKRAKFGVNAIAGKVNAIEICTTGFDMPTPDALLSMFDADIASGHFKL